jgi:formate hydrogenlyase subunit 3/multisubunit Na+/H+ antiporter MnhD subunit
MLRFYIGAAMLLAVAPFGLPFENTWFAGFFAGVTCVGVLVSAIVSMREPTEDSSAGYVWLFRFGHSLFHLGTAYYAHPSLWKYFKAGPRDDRRQHREGE